jgi:hypothetical protein
MIENEAEAEIEAGADEELEEGIGKKRWIFGSFRRRGNLEIHRSLLVLDHLRMVREWSRLASETSKNGCSDSARERDENRGKRGERTPSLELVDRVREGESGSRGRFVAFAIDVVRPGDSKNDRSSN